MKSIFYVFAALIIFVSSPVEAQTQKKKKADRPGGVELTTTRGNQEKQEYPAGCQTVMDRARNIIACSRL
jgi:hypothetical protein